MKATSFFFSNNTDFDLKVRQYMYVKKTWYSVGEIQDPLSKFNAQIWSFPIKYFVVNVRKFTKKL